MMFMGHKIIKEKGMVTVVDLTPHSERRRAIFPGNCPRDLEKRAINCILKRKKRKARGAALPGER